MKKIISMIISCMMLCSFMMPVVNAEDVEYVEGQVVLSEAENEALKSQIEAAFPGDTINISYIGGSITYGDGTKGAAGYANSWASLVTAKFAELCPDKTVTSNNVAISDTLAEFGMYRFKRSVVEKDPDIVFIEYGINNRNSSSEELGNKYEGMIRTLLEMEKVPYVVIVYAGSRPNSYRYAFVDEFIDYYGVQKMDLYNGVYYELVPEMIEKYETPEGYWENAEGVDAFIRDYMSRGNKTSGGVIYSSAAEYMAAVTEDDVANENYNEARGHKKTDVYPNKSDMYGEAFGEWSEEEALAWNATDIFWFNTILSDNVHPNNAGYYRYAREMFEVFIKEGFKKPDSGLDYYYEDTVINPDVVPVSLAKITGFTQTDTPLLPMDDFMPYKATEPGATIEFNFYGNVIGLMGLRSKFGGTGADINFVIDEGCDNEIVGLFNNYCGSSNAKAFMLGSKGPDDAKGQSRSAFTSDKLSIGWHTIKLTTAENCSVDNPVTIGFFALSCTYATPEITGISVDGKKLEMEGNSALAEKVEESITIELDGYPDYDTANEDNILLKVNDVLTGYTGTIEGNEYTLTDFDVNGDATYEIVVTDNVTYAGLGGRTSVKIVPTSGYTVSGLKFMTYDGRYITSSDDLTAGIKVSINVLSTKSEDNLALITVHRDDEGKIKAVKSDVKKPQEEKVTLTADLAFDTLEEGDIVEGYVWVENTLCPLTEKIVFSTSTLEMEKGDRTLMAFVVNEEKLSDKITTVKGIRSGEGIITVEGTSEGSIVTVRIINSEGKNVYFGQTECIDGAYSIDCKSQYIKDDSFILYVSCN